MLNDVAEQGKHKLVDCLKGDLMEPWHGGTLLIDAAKCREHDVYADVPRDHSPTDIAYGNRHEHHVGQLKFYGTAEKSATGLSKTKYEGMDKVAPKDQVDSIREIAGRRHDHFGSSRPDLAKQYDDTRVM